MYGLISDVQSLILQFQYILKRSRDSSGMPQNSLTKRVETKQIKG